MILVTAKLPGRQHATDSLEEAIRQQDRRVEMTDPKKFPEIRLPPPLQPTCRSSTGKVITPPEGTAVHAHESRSGRVMLVAAGAFDYVQYDATFIAFDAFEPDTFEGLRDGRDEFRLDGLRIPSARQLL